MKKVGIATITSTKEENVNYNYGNVLQNYALSYYIKKYCNLKVETIYYSSTVPEFTLKMAENKQKHKFSYQLIDDFVRIFKRTIYKKNLEVKKEKRNQLFSIFLSKYIHYSEKNYNIHSNFSELNEIYDFIITGSDQVWNPYYEGFNPFYYLGYISKEKRISYAPSIGVTKIPKEMEEKFGEMVSQLEYISIREKQGKLLLKEKYGIDAELVCDPVFLLSAAEWMTIAKIPNDLPRKYFAVYILGKKSVETKKYIKKFEKKYNMKAIDLYTRDDNNSFFCGPEEFVGIIANADFVLTDSFHGSAFSVIFKKPLVVIDRNAANKSSKYKMNSRIESLLQLVEMENRNPEYLLKNSGHFCDKYNMSSLKNIIYISKVYLKNALKMEDIKK